MSPTPAATNAAPYSVSHGLSTAKLGPANWCGATSISAPISTQKTLTAQRSVEPIRFGVSRALEIVDQNRRVYDDHVTLFRLTLETRAIEIAIPGDLPSQAAETALPLGLDQQAERFLHNGPFRSGAAAAHCLAHQTVVDINVGPHLPYV